jgi:hypothetical protein
MSFENSEAASLDSKHWRHHSRLAAAGVMRADGADGALAAPIAAPPRDRFAVPTRIDRSAARADAEAAAANGADWAFSNGQARRRETARTWRRR